MTYGKFLFAIGIIASGVLMFVNGGFYSPWVPVTKWIPGHVVLGYASAAILTIGGVGLLVKATAERSARVLFWFLLAFLIVMKTPPALAEANVEVHWLDEGQIAVLVWLGPLLGKLGSMELWVDVVVTIAVANAMFAVASRIPKHPTAEPLS